MRQAGQDPSQVLFRKILLHLRNGENTEADWQHLMERTPAKVQDMTPFQNALHLHPTKEAVAEYVSKLHACGQPVATIRAVHTGPNASKASPGDAGGLQPIICMAEGAHVMLTSNLWTEGGLVNGAMGTVAAIVYKGGDAPPALPVAIMVYFDSYPGPTYPDGTVPICPRHSSWYTSGIHCSRLQIPLMLAWAVTIHKSQSLSLDKLVVDVGKKEFSSGLTYVALSRVRSMSGLLFDPPFPFQRISNLSRSRRLQERLNEDSRLLDLQATTLQLPQSPVSIQSSSQLPNIQSPMFSTTPSPSSSPRPMQSTTDSFAPMVATPLPLSTHSLTSFSNHYHFIIITKQQLHSNSTSIPYGM